MENQWLWIAILQTIVEILHAIIVLNFDCFMMWY